MTRTWQEHRYSCNWNYTEPNTKASFLSFLEGKAKRKSLLMSNMVNKQTSFIRNTRFCPGNPCRMVLLQWFPTRAITPPQAHVAMSGDFGGCHSWVGERKGINGV